MIENPFTFGNPIREPSRFYGRENEMRQVVSRLISSGRDSTSIVGERRTGKTSLLYYLAHPQVAKRFGFDQGYCMVYIDFQGLVDITPQRFWERVLKKMSRAVCHQAVLEQISALQQMQEFDLFDLEDLFESAARAGMTTAFLLDEFEYVTQNTNFKADFFGGLRALAIHHSLPLITATRRELVDLCHSDEIKGSPFFNIFASVVLRPFSRKEVDALLEGSLKGSDLALSPEEKELIYRLAGGNPFYVQMAGYYTVEARNKGLIQNALVEKVSRDFEEQSDPHFAYLWSHCSESEKITLLAVISLSRQKPSRKTLTNLENLSRLHARAPFDVPNLVKRGLLLKNEQEESYHLFSPSMERWIGREISSSPQDEASPDQVREWMDTSGLDLGEPVQGALTKFKRKYWPVVSLVLRELSYELAGAATFQMLVHALT
jgi:AAA+ ATPase superfamily predicted ATPase